MSKQYELGFPLLQSLTLQTSLKKGDVIELRCPSTFGRSPWLECVVDKVATVAGTPMVDVGAVVVGDAPKRVLPRSFVRLVETKEAAAARKKALLVRAQTRSNLSPLTLLLSPTARRTAMQPVPASARAAVAAGPEFAGGLALALGPLSPAGTPASAPARSLFARSFSFSGRVLATATVGLTPSPLSPVRPIGSALGLGRAPSSSDGVSPAASVAAPAATAVRSAPPGGSPAGAISSGAPHGAVSGAAGTASAATGSARVLRSADVAAHAPSLPPSTAVATFVTTTSSEAEVGADSAASTASAASHSASGLSAGAFDIRDFDLGTDSDGELDTREVFGAGPVAVAAAPVVDGRWDSAAALRPGTSGAPGFEDVSEGEGLSAGAAPLAGGRPSATVAVPFVSASAVLARHGAYAAEPAGTAAGGVSAALETAAASRPPGSSPEVAEARAGAGAGAATHRSPLRPRAGSGGAAVLSSVSAMVTPAVGPLVAADAAFPQTTALPPGRERAPSFGGTAAFFPAPDPPLHSHPDSPGRGRVSPFSSRRRQLSFGERGGEVRRRACIIQ
jgi:hypothetical protein